jgi:hypothetical protein
MLLLGDQGRYIVVRSLFCSIVLGVLLEIKVNNSPLSVFGLGGWGFSNQQAICKAERV